MIDLATETKIGGVRVRLTKRQRQLPSRERLRLSRWVRAVGHCAAASRRRWLVDRKVTPSLDKVRGVYRRGRYVISQTYARKMGLERNWFRSREEFLREKPRARVPYWNTGGMWGKAPPDQYGTKGGGMQVRGSGRSGAVIDFYGQSVGRSTVEAGTFKRGKRAGQTRYKGRIANALKAATVFQQTGNNLTTPDDDQIEDLIAYVTEAVMSDTYASLGVPDRATRSAVNVSYNDGWLGLRLEKLKPR